jgi:hypothetical protein
MRFTFQWTSNPMNVITRAAFVVLVLSGGLGAALPAVAQPPSQQQTEYVPIDQLPPQDQLPAAPLLIGAYVFVPLVLFLYLLSVAKRTSAVQREIERLEGDLKRGRA